MQNSNLFLFQRFHRVHVGPFEIGIAHVVVRNARREPDRDTGRAENLECSVSGLKQEPRPLLDGAAIVIGSFVRAVFQELRGQITICAVNLDAVKACVFRVLGSFFVICNGGLDFFNGQFAWRHGWFDALWRERLAVERHRRWCDRQLSTMKIRVGCSPGMPELRENETTGVMNSLGYLLPSRDLLGRIDTGGIRPADRLGADLGAFRENKTRRCALRVICRSQLIRHMIPGSSACHRRHEDPILEGEFLVAQGS